MPKADFTSRRDSGISHLHQREARLHFSSAREDLHFIPLVKASSFSQTVGGFTRRCGIKPRMKPLSVFAISMQKAMVVQEHLR
jgi:hypothetical protein